MTAPDNRRAETAATKAFRRLRVIRPRVVPEEIRVEEDGNAPHGPSVAHTAAGLPSLRDGTLPAGSASASRSASPFSCSRSLPPQPRFRGRRRGDTSRTRPAGSPWRRPPGLLGRRRSAPGDGADCSTEYPARPLHLNVATAIGFAASTLLPARAGEIVRPVALSRMAALPFTPCLLSIALERLIDLMSTVALFVVYAVGWAPKVLAGDEVDPIRSPPEIRVSSRRGDDRGHRAFSRSLPPGPTWRDDSRLRSSGLFPPRFSGRLEALLSHLLDGLASLRSPRDAALVAAQSALLWLVICVQIWCTLKAFDLTFPFPVTFFVLTWAVMGLAIPTPGGVGGYHAAIAYCLTGFYVGSAKTRRRPSPSSPTPSPSFRSRSSASDFSCAGGFSLKSLSSKEAGRSG